ncbi:MAG: glycosyltransferase family 39 protein [Bacteroidota bacterium]
MISDRRYWLLLFLIALVYGIGMFSILFENDSAQFAVMAMRMVQENDFLSLFKGPQEYLDKPHMHFWLAALSFKVFGIYDWAYRIPGLLATFLAAYSCYGLGTLLYTRNVGKLAALIFLSAQTIVLSVIDVRTDAVLTGFAIFSIWQLASYVEKRSLIHMILGALGAGIAFSTKGQIALLVISLPLLCHLGYSRKWQVLINWRVLVGLLVFGLAIAPMLYAYYHQFDLHPEKIIRRRGNRSGIYFIFWEQSFERLSGSGMGKNSSDYFFFFHTFLWVFLPWTILGLAAFWIRARAFVKLRFAYRSNYELLTLGGIALIFFVISFAQFKLPHYLNITIPLFSVLTASYIHSLYRYKKRKVIKVMLGIQYAVLGLVFIATTLLCLYVFKFRHAFQYAPVLLVALPMVVYVLKREAYYFRLITISVLSSFLLNSVLNAHFYPSLLEYQAGSSMAAVVRDNKVPKDNIYKLSDRHTWTLDFYNGAPLKITSLEKIRNTTDFWLYVTDAELQQLRELDFDWDRKFTEKQFRITRLQAKFLNPNTREKVLNKMHLIHIN